MSGAAILNFESDDIILEQGDTGRNLYKVMSGSVGLYINYEKPDEYLVGVVSSPKCFGEMTVLMQQPSYYTVVAMTDVSVLRVPEENFDAFIQSDHQNAMMIIKTMARNLSMVNMNMTMLIDELKALSREDRTLKRMIDTLTVPRQMGTGTFDIGAPQKADAAAPESDAQEDIRAVQKSEFSGIIRPKYKQFVFGKDYICPHCGKSFSAERIFHSKLIPRQASGKQRYDLRKRYQNFEVEWYEVVTCPYCYFSALSDCFLEARRLWREHYGKKLKELRASIRLDFRVERDLDFVLTQHYLALECAAGFSDVLKLRAHLWDNLYRIYWSIGEEDLSRMAEKNAIELYQQTYSTCEMDLLQEQYLCMKIAGMLYAADRTSEAREWAIKARDIPAGKSGVEQLAEDLLAEIRAKENE